MFNNFWTDNTFNTVALPLLMLIIINIEDSY